MYSTSNTKSSTSSSSSQTMGEMNLTKVLESDSILKNSNNGRVHNHHHMKKSSFRHNVSVEIPTVEESKSEESEAVSPLGSDPPHDSTQVHPLHCPSMMKLASSARHSPNSSSSSSSSSSSLDLRKAHIRRNSSSSSSILSVDGTRPPRRRTLSSSSLILSDRLKSLSRRQSSSSSCTSGCSILGSDDETLEDLMDSLKIRKQVLGDSHPKVGLSYNQIGNCHFHQGEFVAAADLYVNALHCFKCFFCRINSVVV